MQPQAGTRPDRPAADNIDTILRLEKQDEEELAVHHRLFHWIGWFVGTIHFIVLQCAFVVCWVILSRVFRITPSTNIRSRCLRPSSRSRPFF
jgi:uncharacterized membrane protein